MRQTQLTAPPVQSADLHLFVFDRALHPELFRTYAQYRVQQGKYIAQISVVGLSHMVQITCGSRTVVEYVGRETEFLPSRGVVTRFRLKGERDHERKLPEGGCYMVSSQVETMDEALYKSVHTDLLRHAGRRGWLHKHDEWADGDLAPFTHLDHEARDGEFHVYAYHTFPHERTLVKTQSIFELR
ncbi:MAG: DUF2617 family protein [Phycisphaerae bacterium]|nr:DUF2617 family protein [Phycisphaerae bacterium]